MTPTEIITIDGAQLVATLTARGWTQHVWVADDGAVCAHEAIRLCSPVPGDAHLVQAVADAEGWGTGWNDASTTTEAMVRQRLGCGIRITDRDLANTFGPQWRAVVTLVRQAATMTPDQATQLATARDDAWAAARAAARDAAWDAARAAARDAAGAAAGAAAWDAARDAARDAATWDLAHTDGPYTPEHRRALITPWAAVMGPVNYLATSQPTTPQEGTP